MRVVIVGAGFGGMAAAKALRKTPAEVALIDGTNHHPFQLATGATHSYFARNEVQAGRMADPPDCSKPEQHYAKLLSAIRNLVCPGCGGPMGGRSKEFKCRGQCGKDWRPEWERLRT